MTAMTRYLSLRVDQAVAAFLLTADVSGKTVLERAVARYCLRAPWMEGQEVRVDSPEGLEAVRGVVESVVVSDAVLLDYRPAATDLGAVERVYEVGTLPDGRRVTVAGASEAAVRGALESL
eukprot:Hpha_TRINITY_DN28393_c0_g1::TRINITY_DN28393_c0_g1_i1::g.2307::m.2307